MKTVWYVKASFILIGLSFLSAWLLFPNLPDQMATHWNIQGLPDGYKSKFQAVVFIPILSIILISLLLFLPVIDPLKKNIGSYRRQYEQFIFSITFFLFYVNMLMLGWNSGFRFNFIQFLTPVFVLLFYSVGILMEHVKQNWFIGIRTPWTLSDQQVWKKTHQAGGKFFKISAFVLLAGVIYPRIFFILLMICAVGIVVYSTGYSYYLYRATKKRTI